MYERVAPALLPEPHQTVRVAVRGPRYWPQLLDWSSRGAAGADGTGAAAALNNTIYRQLLLFVKKRAGSLSYSQDPSGIRSLLSRAFHNQ
ncbi:hypothetical protein VOLCADRAFT_58559, partial [Volvox carteri f. nagariensis]